MAAYTGNRYAALLQGTGQTGTAPAKAYLQFGEGENAGTFQVQFNPAELSFSAGQTGKKKKKDFQSGKKTSACTWETVPGIRMNIKLVFDAGIEEWEGSTCDVQGKVRELFEKKKKNCGDTKAAFLWGEFVFPGILEGLSAEYTMFSPEGKILRANVELTIYLNDKQKVKELMGTHYDSLFKSPGKGQRSSAGKALLAVVKDREEKETTDILVNAAAALRGGGTLSMADGMELFEVQYNPASFSVRAESTRREFENGADKNTAESLSQSVFPGEQTFSVELLLEGEETQKTVLGFLGMLSSERKRQVLFAWGDFCFPGRVESMSGSCTMFDPFGNPIRAKVSMTLRLMFA